MVAHSISSADSLQPLHYDLAAKWGRDMPPFAAPQGRGGKTKMGEPALLEVSGVGSGDGGAVVELMVLLGKQLFERGEEQEDVGRAGAETHQADAPDFAF